MLLKLARSQQPGFYLAQVIRIMYALAARVVYVHLDA